MKTNLLKSILVLAAFALYLFPAFGQSPEKMSYQAVIRNSSDALVTNTNVGMQISILQGSANGTAVYVERHFPTSNSNGLVSLEIGTGTVISGSFSTIDWSDGPYFIQTDTDLNGGANYTITGTSQLLSVPYALYAKTAEAVTGSITETDPVFTAWDKSTGISITESQITDLGNYVETETDPAVAANFDFSGAEVGDLLQFDGTKWVRVTPTYISDYTVTESDVTAHQEALTITESQISDLGTYLTTETQSLADVLAIDNSANTQIKNVTNPTDDQDAATKAYVDALQETVNALLSYFQNIGGVALVSTSSITNITATSATGGGNAISDGGNAITDRGVVWSTSQNPTTTSNQGITSDGTGTGTFTSSLTGLTAGTKYYVRAYATNSAGTAYGNQVEFETTTNGGGGEGTVTDADGNVYATVIIGEQEWMAENLKTTKYNDGTDIPHVTDNGAWANLTTGAYCWYNNDQTAYGDTYGALYNWYAVETGKLCPTGWHVPTDAEWTQLTDYLGGDDIAGGKLKATSGWSNNGNGTDDYGFSALPGGSRGTYGSFYYVGYYGCWWSATERSTNYAWSRYMYYYDFDVYWSSNYKEYGFSVRCLRD